MSLVNKMKRLIPYVGEHFISYPLFEEGDYRPTVTIWQIYKSDDEIPHEYIDSVEADFYIGIEKNRYPDGTLLVEYQISNAKDATKCGKYNLKQMLDIAFELTELNRELKEKEKTLKEFESKISKPGEILDDLNDIVNKNFFDLI